MKDYKLHAENEEFCKPRGSKDVGIWAPVRVGACKGHIVRQASEREAECLGWDGWEKRPVPGGPCRS